MTIASEQRAKRSYHDACGAARALDLVGERWTLLVVRELLLGPKRFTDLRAGLPGISPNVLSQRLDELVQIGVVHKRKLPPPVGAAVYDLTDWGRELDDVIVALNRWGARTPNSYSCSDMSTDSLMVTLRTFFQPERAAGVRADYDLYFAGTDSGTDEFHAVVADGTITITRGASGTGATAIHTTVPAFIAVAFHGRPLTDSLSSGETDISGDSAAVAQFVSFFELPPECSANPPA
ncbi:winged helix-turn-helix transcriptional regulator [Nocardia anaemiae]|uniref:winged helix-turn-helix transcriptional regulator n=1 Tax=Nocardia anaemiae TaxID=263910 RepID=UPI0007A54928|nr:helix-turn-helix domain-containing protein [Nocardia anaemiae]